jgi:RHS repeat-associated protein
MYVRLTTAIVTTGTEYAANYRLENGTLTMIHTDAGYFTPVPPPSGVGSTTYNHIWYLKDHLGNNRVLADGNGAVYAVNDYDPFGNSMTSPITGLQPTFPAGTTASPYKYGGKEWNTTSSTYDFEARQMAPGFHRFTTMDPLCEKYYGISPYAYCADNPINFVDPNGKDTWDKVVGFLVGVITNVIPFSSVIRDWFTPSDSQDYNHTLEATDKAAEFIGTTSLTAAETGFIAGGTMTAAGGGVSLSVVGSPEGLVVMGSGVKLIVESVEVGIAGLMLMANSKSNQTEGYDRGNSRSGSSAKTKSSYQLNREIKQGKAPESIERFDPGNPNHLEKKHVHFKDGSALNIDGSWKHGGRELKPSEIKYLQENGWIIPKTTH